MKLAVVVPVLGQHELANVALDLLIENQRDENTVVFAFDNGNDFVPNNPAVRMIKPGRNIGVYPVFKYAFDFLQGHDYGFDIVAFFHSDLMVPEQGYDMRLIQAFESHPKLGLMGFVGSTQIDVNGGRGVGTTSNFQGAKYFSGIMNKGETWTGSPAEAHGMRFAGYTNAAVVDGCAMVIRTSMWNVIGYREGFPIHHFYDRLISTQMLENGFEVAVLGIACDHISGQTVAKEERYGDLAKEWCQRNNVPMTHNWDDAIYREAERRWLYEYRQVKRLIPISV